MSFLLLGERIYVSILYSVLISTLVPLSAIFVISLVFRKSKLFFFILSFCTFCLLVFIDLFCLSSLVGI